MIQKEYEDLLIIQYSDKPKASAMVSAIVNRFKNTFDTLSMFETEFDLDTARGVQLDIIGKIVGISRNVENVIPKIFFGFDDNINAKGFGLAQFFTLDQSEYSDTQLTDSDYRFFIKMKIIKNMAKATMADDDSRNINSVLFSLFGGNAYFIDNKDMTLDLYIENSSRAYLLPFAQSFDLIPLPQAVGINYVFLAGGNSFGFSNNPNSKGFNNGTFARFL
jgi:hypothetical protein